MPLKDQTGNIQKKEMNQMGWNLKVIEAYLHV